ncbi:MAG: flagellar protein FlaG [Betaproteobacteria bacterium]|nr:flagellar protein FlaG [Betaproteobacteria bacterium]
MIISNNNGVVTTRVLPSERPSPPPPAPAGTAPAQAKVAAPEQVEQAAQLISKAIQPLSRNLRFSVDGTTGKTVVRVEDTETGNLIRQIPSQEALDIARVLDRMQGLLLNGKA